MQKAQILHIFIINKQNNSTFIFPLWHNYTCAFVHIDKSVNQNNISKICKVMIIGV